MKNQIQEFALIRKLSILVFIVGLSDFIFGSVYVSLMRLAGLSPAVLGIGFFSMMAISTIIEVFSGDWGDRWGHRRISVFGLNIWGISLVIFSLSLSQIGPLFLLFSLTLWSIGQALYSGAPISLVINSIPETSDSTREKAIQLHSIFGWIGRVAGAFVATVGVVTVEPRIIVSFSGIILILLSLWMLFSWPESERETNGEQIFQIISRVKRAWKKSLYPLLVYSFVSSCLLSVVLFAWQPVINEVLGIKFEFNGIILLGLTSLAAVGAGLSRFKPLFSSETADAPTTHIIVALSFCVFAVIPNVSTAIIMLVVSEILLSYSLTTLAIYAHKIFIDKYRNLLWSSFSATMGLGMALADLLFGFIWGHYSILQAFLSLGIGVLTVSIFMLLYSPIAKLIHTRI